MHDDQTESRGWTVEKRSTLDDDIKVIGLLAQSKNFQCLNPLNYNSYFMITAI